LSTAFTVYIDGIECEVDRDMAIGDGPSVFEAGDDDQFGYLVDVCGDWLHHWAADSVDEYVRIDNSLTLEQQVNDLVLRSGLYDLVWAEGTNRAWRIEAEGE
jgi:hypothetical protein